MPQNPDLIATKVRVYSANHPYRRLVATRCAEQLP
jgi:hypothetical protein